MGRSVLLVVMALCMAFSLRSTSCSAPKRKKGEWERLGLIGKRSATGPQASVEHHETSISSHHFSNSHKPVTTGVQVHETGDTGQHERVTLLQ